MPQRLRRSPAAQLHAGGMNHMPGFEVSATGNGRVTHRDAANFVALALDRLAAFPADGAGYPAAENQVIVRGVDDGVRLHFREVSLLDYDPRRCCFRALLTHLHSRLI